MSKDSQIKLLWFIILASVIIFTSNIAIEILNKRKWLTCIRGEDGYGNFDCHQCDEMYNKHGRYHY